MSKPVRILLQVDSLGLGGLEKKVCQLALRLDRQRFEPIVSYSSEWGIYGEELQRAGIPVVRIVPEWSRCRGVVKATRQVRELKPQIFHTFSCRQNASDVLVARRAGVPVIISARDNVRHWSPSGPARNWEFDRNRMTHFVTPCCEAAAHLCRKLEGVRHESIVVIHNGVDLETPASGPSIREELALPAGAFVAGYAARYRGLKAHESLLRALRKIADRRPEIYVVCCGIEEAGVREQLQASVQRLSLQQHITLLGPRQDMSSFYRGLDLYAHPSDSEALSMAILEAMSHRLPVVATSVGGTSEAVVAPETGLLVPRGDSSALARAVLDLMDRPEERTRMGVAGRQRVEERFSMARMVTAYEDLYMRATEDSAPTAGVPAEAPKFTGSCDSNVLADTTVFVTTVGDRTNFLDCLEHLRAQTVRCRIEVIDRVAPMSAAFARMHKLCTTLYYVQVDEDMILHPDALGKLHDLMLTAPPEVALVCAPLWDCDVESPILGVKIYRHSIVRQFPYQDTLSCEVKQLDELRVAGYKAQLLSTEDASLCVGEHGKHYTPETIFRRWQRHFHKHNRLGHLAWLEPWPARLMERYATTRDPLHLYAALGAIAGIAGRADPNRELDWRDIDPALQRMRYYFPVRPEFKP